jgi:hypothetical protein
MFDEAVPKKVGRSLPPVKEQRLKQGIKNAGDAGEAAGSGCNGRLARSPWCPIRPPLGQV